MNKSTEQKSFKQYVFERLTPEQIKDLEHDDDLLFNELAGYDEDYTEDRLDLYDHDIYNTDNDRG